MTVDDLDSLGEMVRRLQVQAVLDQLTTDQLVALVNRLPPAELAAAVEATRPSATVVGLDTRRRTGGGR